MLGVVYCEVLTAGAADPVREEEEDFCSSSLSRSRLRDADAKKVVHVCCRGAAARRGRGRSGWMPFRSPSAACQPAARGPRAARGRRVGPLMAMPRWFAGEATCAFCMEWCCPEFSRFPTSARSVEEDAEACGRSTSTAPRRARIPGGRGAAVFAPAAPASRGRRARVSMEGAGPWSLPFGRLEFDIGFVFFPYIVGAHSMPLILVSLATGTAEVSDLAWASLKGLACTSSSSSSSSSSHSPPSFPLGTARGFASLCGRAGLSRPPGYSRAVSTSYALGCWGPRSAAAGAAVLRGVLVPGCAASSGCLCAAGNLCHSPSLFAPPRTASSVPTRSHVQMARRAITKRSTET
ncbi:unnamed protein product [Prorocentrum cordatum]|uniref:Uncharacterized protein n=1 Tax=Prorocentrum cordatum TaxID=2364126 RepID=A0ABN9RC37_9DINO|nr:unnamed protein product [Polarella glacialis]